jgi:hypothetical protein
MYPYTIGANDTITVHMGGRTRTVRTDHPNYQQILECLSAEDWERLEALIDPATAIEQASKGEFRVVDGQVLATDFNGREFEVPSGLNEEILKYQRLGLDYGRLLLFARRLMENPSYRAVHQLFKWIHRAGLTITENGKFIAYRGVMKVNSFTVDSIPEADRERLRDAQYVDWHTKAFDNSIGKTVSMPRNQVDENPKNSCAAGLHAATYNYAHSGYGPGRGADGEILFIEICPSDVVAVPNGEPDKMRVCKYVVKGISEAPIDEPHYNECDTDPCLDPPDDLEETEYVDHLPEYNPPPPKYGKLLDDECEDGDDLYDDDDEDAWY